MNLYNIGLKDKQQRIKYLILSLLEKKVEVGLDLQQHQVTNNEWILPVRNLPLINSRNLDIVSDYLL